MTLPALKNSTALAFTDSDKANLKQSLCKNLTNGEFETFIKVCVEKRLSPFKNQIYAIKRGNVVGHQTSIDGYRAIAGRTGMHDSTEIFYKAKGEGKPWLDYWEDDHAPSVAKAVVYKRGSSRPFTATAKFSSYRVDKNPLWRTMPENMLAKCAEALALRKAFPEDLSGLHTAEEMAQAENVVTTTVSDLNNDMVEDAVELYTAAPHQKELAFNLMKQAGIIEPEALSELNRLLIEGNTVYSEDAIKLSIKEETEGL